LKTILAFLQSPSESIFPPGTAQRVIDEYRNNQEYHRKMLKASMSGHRLAMAFGSLFNEIIWDNVAPNGQPDLKHVEMSIQKHSPYLILTFGVVAEETLDHSVGALPLKVMCCHHPNARFKTQADLDHFANKVIEFNRNWTIDDES
jgi:hypothetical protein